MCWELQNMSKLLLDDWKEIGRGCPFCIRMAFLKMQLGRCREMSCRLFRSSALDKNPNMLFEGFRIAGKKCSELEFTAGLRAPLIDGRKICGKSSQRTANKFAGTEDRSRCTQRGLGSWSLPLRIRVHGEHFKLWPEHVH